MLRTLLTIFILVVLCETAKAQTVLPDGNIEAVILYNRQPFLAKLTPDGKIIELLKEMPNYMAEHQKALDVINTEEVYFGSSESTSNVVTQAPDSSPPISNTGYIHSGDTKKSIFLQYPLKKATFDAASLAALDEVAIAYSNEPHLFVKIVGFASNNSGVEKKLATNRTKACSDYLKLKGVPAHQISIEIQGAGGRSEEVIIELF